MKIHESVREGVGVITLSGKLMVRSELADLHTMVKDLIGRGISSVVLDLEAVEWINSAAVGEIVSALTSCRSVGGDLAVAGASGKVSKILEITQVVQVFDCFESTDEAVESLRTGDS